MKNYAIIAGLVLFTGVVAMGYDITIAIGCVVTAIAMVIVGSFLE